MYLKQLGASEALVGVAVTVSRCMSGGRWDSVSCAEWVSVVVAAVSLHVPACCPCLICSEPVVP